MSFIFVLVSRLMHCVWGPRGFDILHLLPLPMHLPYHRHGIPSPAALVADGQVIEVLGALPGFALRRDAAGARPAAPVVKWLVEGGFAAAAGGVADDFGEGEGERD